MAEQANNNNGQVAPAPAESSMDHLPDVPGIPPNAKFSTPKDRPLSVFTLNSDDGFRFHMRSDVASCMEKINAFMQISKTSGFEATDLDIPVSSNCLNWAVFFTHYKFNCYPQVHIKNPVFPLPTDENELVSLTVGAKALDV